MKKIVLFIMMFLCSIMPIRANSLASIDYLLELSFYYTARTAQLEAERDANLAISDLRATLW